MGPRLSVPARDRAGLADRLIGAGLQDHCGLPQGQLARPSARSAVPSWRCAPVDLLSVASVAIDASEFKVVNARDKNFTKAKMKRRPERIEESIERYMAHLLIADRRGDAVPEAKVVRLKDKIVN